MHYEYQDSEMNNAKYVLVHSEVIHNMHFKDSFYWPSTIIDDNFIAYCIENGSAFFQNDNCSFEKSARRKGEYRKLIYIYIYYVSIIIILCSLVYTLVSNAR